MQFDIRVALLQLACFVVGVGLFQLVLLMRSLPSRPVYYAPYAAAIVGVQVWASTSYSAATIPVHAVAFLLVAYNITKHFEERSFRWEIFLEGFVIGLIPAIGWPFLVLMMFPNL